MTDTYSGHGWACTDCVMLLANGEAPGNMSADDLAEYLAAFDRGTDGIDVVLGMMREDHACATTHTVTYAPTRYSRKRLTVDVRAADNEQARWNAETALPYGARIIGHPRPHELATESDRGGECECEQMTFTWSACDVCGSNLGGARNAVTFWTRESAAV